MAPPTGSGILRDLTAAVRASRARIESRRREWLAFYYTRYVGMIERFENFVRTRGSNVTCLAMDQVRACRRSDTIFLLGSGPSINRMTEENWSLVRRHDSMAITWFILHPHVPTYFHTEINLRPRFRQSYVDAMARRAGDYSETVMFVHHLARRRGMHPRYIPEFFPRDPKVCFFRLPPVIQVPKTRPFAVEDFRDSCVYRGTMNNAFYLAAELGYTTLVLLGVDLHTQEYFFDDDACMRWMRDGTDYPSLEERRKHPYGYDHLPDVGRFKHSVVDVYHAVNEFYFKPRGIRLYVGAPDSLLHPRIPVYPGFSDRLEETRPLEVLSH